MKEIVTNFMIMASIILCLPLMAKASENNHYLLHQGDRLDISVWGDKSLAKELKVLPDGSISFPLTGRVEVAGKSSTEVEQLISKKLTKYLPEPEVTVIVVGTEGSKIYILGKVKQPGPVLLTGPITVLQALSIAGGFDKFADTDSIKILKSKKNGGQVLVVDYTKLLKGQDLNTNYVLTADDTILVP